MIRRLAFTVFFVFGGFLFYIPKWILFGTRASRERKEMIKLQREQNALLKNAAPR